MRELLEIAKTAVNFSDIYPLLITWKKSVADKFAFVSFDEMALAALDCADLGDFDLNIFSECVDLIKTWRAEVQETFKIDFKSSISFQVDYAFPFAAPLQHIVEAENRLFVFCILMTLKGFDQSKLYKEFEFFKKAHERHWTITGITTSWRWAKRESIDLVLSPELKTKRRMSALSLI